MHVPTTPSAALRRAQGKVGAVPGESREGGSFSALGSSAFMIYSTPNPNRGGHTQMSLRVPDTQAAVAEHGHMAWYSRSTTSLG
jgi:hypothetical protein